MSGLDDRIRLELESGIDLIVEDPNFWEKTFRNALVSTGIEPNFEAVLSMVVGIAFGLVIDLSRRYYGEIRDQDLKAAIELIRRRAWELRETFMKARLSE